MQSSDKYIKGGQFTPAFDTLVTESMENWHVPGFSVAVIQDEEVCAKVCTSSFVTNGFNFG
jgi:hypothetical protein